MKIYNDKYRTRIVAVGYGGNKYAVQCMFTGWFQRWHYVRVVTIDDGGNKYIQPNAVWSRAYGTEEVAEQLQRSVSTFELLQSHMMREKQKLADFQSKQQKLHDTRHDLYANYPERSTVPSDYGKVW